MTEQQLREKLQFAYGNMPDATRAAFEHSLTHHRAPETHRSIGLNRTMRIVITAVLMALMLTAVGVAAARFFSVTDVHPAQDGTEGDYQAHYLALEERYDSDLLSVSVNDACTTAACWRSRWRWRQKRTTCWQWKCAYAANATAKCTVLTRWMSTAASSKAC